ncbi:sulfite exporter TauE/SafE family protein [Aquabacter sp. L1I39]|uniref:sulfite exporter TauE/SafE family protein n=1 Tax=Aquabacter sp. L1I39 TaxID=2820278 RepID=UPI001ADC3D9D|nr:sulfite exporter TauE/SafE family protein [Aquabacter sp. L1I39]QTL02402.1 sulfite exporter TauE/SafE family protein [Aquabacter sp. L1I39]
MSLLVFGGISFLAATFRGLTGFGFALIAALGLFAFPSPSEGVVFILIADLVLTIFLLMDRDHGRVDWPITRMLLVMGFFGALGGTLLAVQLDAETAKQLVAVAVFLAACLAMVRHPPHWLRHTVLGALIACVVGALLAAFAVGGPLIAAWLLARGSDQRMLKGTLAVFFGAVDAISLLARAMLGGLGPDLPAHLAQFGLPTCAGFALGRALSTRISSEAWRRLSAGGLVAIAAAGLVQTVLALGADVLTWQ